MSGVFSCGMHFNGIMFSYDLKPAESKSSRIFRPWDCINKPQDVSQDCTVSTTTTDEEKPNSSDLPDKSPKEKLCEGKSGFRPIKKSERPSVEAKNHAVSQQPTLSLDYPLEAYGVYPEMVQANLAQSLGLTANDPLLMESMMQGIALEEYARVLNQEHQAKILASRKQRPKKYKCPHCDVGFSNNGQLKGHIRIHTGERPFKCDEKDCGKTFTRNEELTRHKRIHSGLRPFPCTHCGKRFGRKDHLKKHSRTHFQPRGLYAVPVMMPLDAWAASPSSYPFVPMFGY